MKATKILLSIAVMGTLTLGFADATNTHTNTQITQKVEAIQNAAPQDRTAMMNELKSQMQNMSQADKTATMKQMKVIPQQHQGKMQEHAQEMQMSHSDNMNREQNMNQHQAGNEYGHSVNEHGGSTSYDSNTFEMKR